MGKGYLNVTLKVTQLLNKGGGRMTKINIRLVTIDDVKDFVKKANELDCEADLSLGKYVVDAKSIMGIFSLDLSKPIKAEVHGENCDEFMNELSRFIVK